MDGERLLARLPAARGRLVANRALADFTWFRVGGPAEVLFTPADEDDLAQFLGELDADIPVTVIGVASNLLVRDGGVRGVVVRLGRGFAGLEAEDDWRVRAGAAVLDVKVARFAAAHGIDGLTFLRGIPGTIGGALRMNGGAYGQETKDALTSARAVGRDGKVRQLTTAEMNYTYRHCGAPADLIFTEAVFQGRPGDPVSIGEAMEAITAAREKTQPIRERTGGSTFKNPPGHKAWRLIDAAGMRGARLGGAKVSDKHCNFLINDNNASASDIEMLGEKVRAAVEADSGIRLEWEIRRIGEAGA